MCTWEIIREIVQERKKQDGVMQKFLATQCKYDEKTFSLLINGKKTITDIDIRKFCNGLGVSPNELLGFKETG